MAEEIKPKDKVINKLPKKIKILIWSLASLLFIALSLIAYYLFINNFSIVKNSNNKAIGGIETTQTDQTQATTDTTVKTDDTKEEVTTKPKTTTPNTTEKKTTTPKVVTAPKCSDSTLQSYADSFCRNVMDEIYWYDSYVSWVNDGQKACQSYELYSTQWQNCHDSYQKNADSSLAKKNACTANISIYRSKLQKCDFSNSSISKLESGCRAKQEAS